MALASISPRFICYGDLCADIFVQADRYPQPGEDAAVHDLQVLPAGSAPNCAAVAARLGIPTELVGLVGDDAQGDMLLDDLRTHGVGTAHIRRVDVPTASTVAILTGDGQRTFLSYRGANAQPYGPLPEDVSVLFSPHGNNLLHVSGYSFQHPDSRRMALVLMAQAEANGARISLDPSFQFARDCAEPALIARLDYVFPNADEARLLSGCANPAEAADYLHAAGARTAVVTLGADGCLIASDTFRGHVPLPDIPIRVVDTTGAGDAFCAGFLAASMWGWGAEHAAQVGHLAAARVISQLGGRTAAPTRNILHELAERAGLSELAGRLRTK